MPLSLFLFIQKTDSSALHAVYVLLLFSSAWCTSHFITESESFFFKTSIVILLVSYTTFMSYHFQVLLAALSQQVQGTLWTSLKLTVYHDPWSYLLLPLRTGWVFHISKLCILGTGTPWNLCIILNQIFCNVVNSGIRNWNLGITVALQEHSTCIPTNETMNPFPDLQLYVWMYGLYFMVIVVFFMLL